MDKRQMRRPMLHRVEKGQQYYGQKIRPILQSMELKDVICRRKDKQLFNNYNINS